MIVIQPLDLLVSRVRREGHKLSGWVVNGAWNLQITETEILAKDGNSIVTRRPIIDYRIIPVAKEDQCKNYNEILSMEKYQ